MNIVNTPLSEIKGIPPRFVPKLKNLGIKTARELLLYVPTRYIDFSRILKISQLVPYEEATIHGVVKKINSRRTWHKKMHLMEAFIEDESGIIRATWFNQPYIKNILKIGSKANFSGKPILSKIGELYLSNPTYEIVSKGKETKHTARIVSIYSETKGLTSKGIRYLISILLKKNFNVEEILPKEILKNEKLPEINTAIKNMHFPKNIESATTAKNRFVFQNLFILQIKNIIEQTHLRSKRTVSIPFSASFIKKLLHNIPFEFTLSQKKALFEILKDIEKPYPMNRLLQGDVGSGKTIIAIILSIIMAERASSQSAFMVPTEILARQHYKTFQKFFPNFERGIALLTSSETRVFYGKNLETKVKKSELLNEIKNGKIHIVMGTHALIQKTVSFKKLGLVLIDEQHRFGVKQRATLLQNMSNDNITPHLLTMSATPIPRTLSLAIFGDLDISVMKELPKGRQEIITKAVLPEKRKDAYEFIRKEINSGRQVFVVCPRIKSSTENLSNYEKPITGEFFMKTDMQKLEIKSVKEEYEKLSKDIFPEFKVAMLHGKMPPNEKNEVMDNFLKGKVDLIVSTSVIEVGVDVPNASIMMIEGAERFGLAQLYQFRGRVGRGKYQSYCFLFTDSKSQDTKKRLNSIVRAKNGLDLAERDLAIRGPGEFLGTIQTGMPDYIMSALKNPKLLMKAKNSAEKLFKEDQTLKKYPLLQKELESFEKRIHLE